MRLTQLLDGIEAAVSGDRELEITGIAYDSRQVVAGGLFVAISGFKQDGHKFIDQAVANGAAAIVVTEAVEREDVTVLRVRDSRRALASLAANYYRHPSRELALFGITGTNGKTTTCHLLSEIFRSQGRKVGTLGTIGNYVDGVKVEAERTTPESLELQQMLRRMVDAGVTHVVMEVSSHALELHRVAGISFRAGVFTNLTQDHLDFHSGLEDYLRAKSKLFEQLGESSHNAYAVLNADDRRSFHFLRQITPVPVIAYGKREAAEVRFDAVELKGSGVAFQLHYDGRSFPLTLSTPGLFTVYNAAAAAAAALREGVSPQAVAEALAAVRGVAGRFERVDCGQDFAVIVDYAHTPDSLENILTAAREFAAGRVITVFGCGGDRDKTKRPLMGEAAAKLSDLTVVTSDNPRSEAPEDIIADILPGVKKHTGRYQVVVDRRQAIEYALQQARQGDTVIIAGKGHETYQEINGEIFPFDDREVAKQLLRRG